MVGIIRAHLILLYKYNDFIVCLWLVQMAPGSYRDEQIRYLIIKFQQIENEVCIYYLYIFDRCSN